MIFITLQTFNDLKFPILLYTDHKNVGFLPDPRGAGLPLAFFNFPGLVSLKKQLWIKQAIFVSSNFLNNQKFGSLNFQVCQLHAFEPRIPSA